MKPEARPNIDVNALIVAEKKQFRRERWLVRLMWAYVGLLVIYWLVLIWSGEAWLPGTLLLYGPRWPSLVPLVVLFLVSLKVTKRTILPAITGALLVLFPIMGFNVPVRALLSSSSDDPARLRIVSFNSAGGKFRAANWEDYLLKTNPDIVVCQEWPTTGARPQHWKHGWHVLEHENVMLIASRYPIAKSIIINEKELGARSFLVAYDLNTPLGSISMVNIHLPTIRGTAGELDEVIHGQTKSIKSHEEAMQRRQNAVRKAHEWIQVLSAPLLIAGDFNMPVDSSLYRQNWSHFNNAFSTAGWGFGYTKWTRWHGVRIDQVLYGEEWKCIRAEVGPDVGSDHLPMMTELLFTGGK